MYEKIVVPLDGSELSELALPYAEELAARLGATVSLIYVSETVDGQYEHMRQFYLEKVADTFKHEASRYIPAGEERPVKVSFTVLVGNPAEEIVRFADREGAGLIVMATHGRSGPGRWALGSVADKVVRAASQPVALIRAKGARPDIRQRSILNRVLIPLDGSTESESAIPCIAEFIARLKVEVVLLEVLSTGYQTLTAEGYQYVVFPENQIESDRAHAKAYLDKIARRLERPEMTVSSEVKLGNAADEIVSFAGEMKADMIAMATHGRSGIGRWVLGSVAERVVRSGTVPTLLVRVPGACAVEE
ncbi:MAG: universal stress protein [Chloroflexi bacterium]|nr:universal stress protein [Chloroflexota bacterium]